jgi:hypothetical protein
MCFWSVNAFMNDMESSSLLTKVPYGPGKVGGLKKCCASYFVSMYNCMWNICLHTDSLEQVDITLLMIYYYIFHISHATSPITPCLCFERLLEIYNKALFRFEHLYFCYLLSCTFIFSFEASTAKVLFHLCA